MAAIIPICSADAVDTDAVPLFDALRHHWHPVAYVSEVREEPHAVTLLGVPLVLVRLDGQLAALHARCPHKGTHLALGRVVDGQIECAYHGWRFDGQGQCRRVPAQQELNEVMQASVPSYSVCEQAGIVWVALESPTLAVPSFPEFDDPTYRVVQGPAYEWRTSAPRRLENFVDFSHFAFVHDGTIGSRECPHVDAVKVWRDGSALRFSRSGVKEPGAGLKKQLLGLADGEWLDPVNEYHVTMPHTVHLHRALMPGKHYVLFMAASPIDATTTRSFWWHARNFGLEPSHDQAFTEFEELVLAQDKPVIESQRPLWMHLGRAPAGEGEIQVRNADVVTREYRRWLADLVAQQPA